MSVATNGHGTSGNIKLVSDMSGFGETDDAYIDDAGTVHIDNSPPITASVPTSTKNPGAPKSVSTTLPATSIVTRNETQAAGVFDFLEGQIFGLPKIVVYGAAAFGVWYFLIRKGRR